MRTEILYARTQVLYARSKILYASAEVLYAGAKFIYSDLVRTCLMYRYAAKFYLDQQKLSMGAE